MTFQVVNGTWEDDTSAAKVTYVTLMKDGKWDMNGSAYLTAPTGMKPDAGYGGTDGTQGGWDTTPPATVSGTDDVTYTYTFAKSTTPLSPAMFCMSWSTTRQTTMELILCPRRRRSASPGRSGQR